MIKKIILSMATIAIVSGGLVTMTSNAEARVHHYHEFRGWNRMHGYGTGHFRHPHHCHWHTVRRHHQWVDVRVCHPKW